MYELSKEELANTKQCARPPEEAVAALEKDHKFLLEGDVFSEDLIETWIQWKREKEIDEMVPAGRIRMSSICTTMLNRFAVSKHPNKWRRKIIT